MERLYYGIGTHFSAVRIVRNYYVLCGVWRVSIRNDRGCRIECHNATVKCVALRKT